MISISAPQITGIRFARWIGLSLALHVVLLAPWPSTPRLTGLRDVVLTVALVPDTEQPRPARLSMHRRSTRVISSQPDRVRPFREHEKTASAITEHAVSSETRPSEAVETGNVSNGSGRDDGASRARIRARLLGDLARHFEYPLVARIRGWQGTVLLELRVKSDGHFDRIRVERSSGYAVLDHSALNSLNRLGHLTEATSWLNGRSIDMQLPVIYRLVEN
jgi:protein TonB